MPRADTPEMVCVACPRGCVLRLRRDGELVKVLGAACERGMEYAESELACAGRVFTGTVRLLGAEQRVIPVRSASAVPRGELRDLARRLSALAVSGPVTIGQVVYTDPALGVDLVATAESPDSRLWRRE